MPFTEHAAGAIVTLYVDGGLLTHRRNLSSADFVLCISMSSNVHGTEAVTTHKAALLAVARLATVQRSSGVGDDDYDAIIGGGGGVQISSQGSRVGGPSALAGLHYMTTAESGASEQSVTLLSRVRFEQDQPAFQQYFRLRIPKLDPSFHVCFSVFDWKATTQPVLCGTGSLSLNDAMISAIAATDLRRQSIGSRSNLPRAVPVGVIDSYAHIFAWSAIPAGTPGPDDGSSLELRHRAITAMFAPARCQSMGSAAPFMQRYTVPLVESRAATASISSAPLAPAAAPIDQWLSVSVRCDYERDGIAVRGALALRAVGVDAKHALAALPVVNLRRLGAATLPPPLGGPPRSTDIASLLPVLEPLFRTLTGEKYDGPAPADASSSSGGEVTGRKPAPTGRPAFRTKDDDESSSEEEDNGGESGILDPKGLDERLFVGICALATGMDDAALRTAFRALDANGDRTLVFEVR
jgi:hypothetical protein